MTSLAAGTFWKVLIVLSGTVDLDSMHQILTIRLSILP